MHHEQERAVRIAQLVSLYDDGLSYAEIGEHLGVTRQRIEQLLRKHGVPKSPRDDRRYAAAVGGREKTIEDLFLKCRDDAQVAALLEMKPQDVRRFIDETVPDAIALRRKRPTGALRYSNRDLITALQEAAPQLASPMTLRAFDSWRKGSSMKRSLGRVPRSSSCDSAAGAAHSRRQGYPATTQPRPSATSTETMWLRPLRGLGRKPAGIPVPTGTKTGAAASTGRRRWRLADMSPATGTISCLPLIPWCTVSRWRVSGRRMPLTRRLKMESATLGRNRGV